MAEIASKHAISFARDLGYLDQFLARLKAHAAGLSGPQGAELTRLLSEEDARWQQIKALLAPGIAPQETRPPSEASTTEAAPRGWTVGSLMPKR